MSNLDDILKEAKWIGKSGNHIKYVLEPDYKTKLEQIDAENNKRIDDILTEQKEIKKKYDKVVSNLKEWAKQQKLPLHFKDNVSWPGILPEFVVNNIMFDDANEEILKNLTPEQLNEHDYFYASMERSENKTDKLINKLTDARPISKKLKVVLKEIFKDATIRVPTGINSNEIIEIKIPGRFKLFRINIKGHPQERDSWIDILPQVEEIIQTLDKEEKK
jgi:hypothetical protein